MEVLAGRAAVDDVDDFLDRLQAVGTEHGSAVQAFDARYVVGRDHLELAVRLANRAAERGQTIANDRAMEILLYAAGTRQIDRALEIGLRPGTHPAVIVADGGDEAGALDALAADFDANTTADTTLSDYDVDRVREFYEVGAAERAATSASLQELVCERVALLVLDR